MIKNVGIDFYDGTHSKLIGCLLLVLALTSCSQKVATTNDVADDAMSQGDADSLVNINVDTISANTITIGNAEIDSFIAENVIVKESLNEDSFGVRYRRIKFIIDSPLNGYKHFKEVDSIVCSFNKWTYTPNAVYEANIKEILDEGCSGEDVVAYRNGIKVMESHDYGCGDNSRRSTTYYYSDGRVADFDSVEIANGEYVFP